MSPMKAQFHPFSPRAHSGMTSPNSERRFQCVAATVLIVLLVMLLGISGCGTGGYAGGGIATLSTSSITIDASQTFAIDSTVEGNSTVSWSIGSCAASPCGVLSNATGSSVTYRAPATLTSQIKLTLTAAVAGTKSAKVVSITVNPAPVIGGGLPSATVGVAYSTTVHVTGGTLPFKWSPNASPLPAGLNFNPLTQIISGTPTVAGTVNFNLQLIDSSDVPYVAVGAESIAVSNAGAALTVVSGNPPAGRVGAAYTTSLSATGGTQPYTWSLIAGSLPGGISLSSSTGVISGMPTTAGSSTFVAQAQDATGSKASATFTIVITTSAPQLGLGVTTLPNGTVGVPYSAIIGVTGGTAPYACVFTAGTLPAGLSLSGCVVSGTPTIAGTSNLTVKATDASTPVQTVSGPIGITITAGSTSLLLTVSTLPGGTVGVPYSATIGVAGGIAPYGCVFTAGTLPAGLSLSGCVVSGTPTVAGTSNLTVKATDASSPVQTVSGPIGITIAAATTPLSLSISTLPNGTVGVPYSATIGVKGGTAPYACTFTAGTLPAGLILSGCAVSGTPTVAGTSNLTVKATDTSSPVQTVSGPIGITIGAAATPLNLTLSTLPSGTVGIAYSATIGVVGGTAPYACTITAGTLQAGLSLNGCVVSGTPTASGTVTLTVRATDSASPTGTTSGPISLTINPAAATLALTLSSLPDGTVGVAYSATIGVSGGTAPYTCLITSGTLPTGLSLSGCVISGTPTTAGISNLTVKATDSANPAQTVSGPVSITINQGVILTLSSPPAATVNIPYSGTIPVTGGTGPYKCVITAGTLPAGLNLSGCLIAGTPTVATTATLTVQATDSSTPTATKTGPVTVMVNAATVVLTLSNPPTGTVGTIYTGSVGVTGGTAPYMCSLVSGAVPPGLVFVSNCSLTGTPTTAATSTFSVKATDAGSPAATTTGSVSITIGAAASTLTITSPPAATVNIPYSGTIPVTGGTGPYACVITAGTLPAGLTLTGCVISGTPTVATVTTITVQATDSSSPAVTKAGPVTVTVNAGTVVLTLINPPNGTVGAVYNGSVGVNGGTAPYSCTLVSGLPPAGLTLANNCSLAGTPTTAATSVFTVKATDASSPAATKTGSVSVTIAAVGTLGVTAPPPATVGTPYTGPIVIIGGTPPYTCTLVSGTLPAGLTLNNCTVIGTPTTPGSSPIVVKVIDTGNPPITTTAPITIVVNPVATLTLTGIIPNAVLGAPYLQTLTASGGIKPYSYAITDGALPAGLTFSAGGVISGTPTVVGASSFTVTATDTESPTPQTASLPLVLLVTYPVTTNDAKFKGPYAFLTTGYDDALLGLLAYQTASVASFTADGAAAISLGEMDSNHQYSTAVANIVSSNRLVGTYQVNADNRGFLALTPLDANGKTGKTRIYALALKAVVAPATIYTHGSLIEADDNQLAGTKATGTLLAQDPAAIATGLTGSYAFGLQGDTACPISCTVGILGGPAASVGQFTVNSSGSTIAGTGDANISAFNFANSTLAGSYGVGDSNGRSQLTMLTSSVPSNYPSDYAVYIVDANNAFILSNDKHSSFILLAGSAQARTQTVFGNASLNNSFIGYENSAANPGLVTGLLLQNVLNFSTATVFRATAAANGSCIVTSVDSGGVDSLVSSVTGLLGSLLGLGLNGVLGTFDTTGPVTCGVATSGRGTIQYPQEYGLLGIPIGTPPAPRVAYLSAPDRGYFLETSYAGIGNIEPQTGQPYNAASFSGTYVYGAPAASSIASINTTGTITSNGNGTATSTTDTNVGIGTLNIIQLGIAGSSTYTTPDATTGRFLINGSVAVYEIGPGRFVAVDTNKLTTAPSYTLLY
jgi:hypothetical protein